MDTLKLGHYDRTSKPDSWRAYIRRYHEPQITDKRFRGAVNNQWQQPKALNGSHVSDLQQNLKSLGYLPQGSIDGIFGYRTHSAVGLFQEYTRSVGGLDSLGIADGLVGPKTQKALQQAMNSKTYCQWTDTNNLQERDWLRLLESVREKYRDEYPTLLPDLFSVESVTLNPDDWQIKPKPVHIIGIRRTAWASSLDSSGKRMNNDVFVVIANGNVIYFFGSTDPTSSYSTNPAGMPFLCKGQHNYRFGFHRLSNKGIKCYRALRPVNPGVRVVRDSNRDKKPSPGDRLDLKANTTINIHWSGRGTSNWSGGCQVIGGALYIDHSGRKVDCWEHAAITYDDIGRGKNRGAYDLMLNWITVCSPDITKNGTIPYTLIEEDDLEILSPKLHQSSVVAFREAAQTVASHDNRIKRFVMDRAPELLA
ncbi:MAG: peptidoglycan-binding protein [Candidatus Thiodiazotropha sp. 6PLUC2]